MIEVVVLAGISIAVTGAIAALVALKSLKMVHEFALKMSAKTWAEAVSVSSNVKSVEIHRMSDEYEAELEDKR